FEGIRGYWNPDHKEIYLLKLAEHYERFARSTALLKIKHEESVERLCELTREVLRRSGYRTDVYVRPLAYKSSPLIKVDLHSSEDSLAILVMAIEVYLDLGKLSIDRNAYNPADEALFSGTGVQIAPIVEIDGRPVGTGKPGSITLSLQEAYFRAVRGNDPRYRQWCTPVYGGMPRIIESD